MAVRNGLEQLTMKTQTEIRDAFWLTFNVEGKPREFYGKRQNDLPADVRAAFCDFVDYLAREGTISESLAARVTL
jgi:hypothetical protein